ncbi:MAG: radical SAM protein [Candidatus Abyssobacteria bacterium SURF_17]|uniref:Radical SAM protein n=1 Tax=Candidatus Abyssobacteria bacterium SURF_17 TaxID=2093361 RepID=A0A419EUP1_9BACT|nr:MAG: radical SAM protein [Candidatus Abyssubacteria bacterium SURF_17]
MILLQSGSRIVLLNLPGKRLYIRDYYCSKVSKTNYLFAPCDFLMLSGRLKERYDVRFVDCIAERLSEPACLTKLSALAPQAIVFLAGSVSWEEDAIFLRKLKGHFPDTLLIGTGDIFLEDGNKVLESNPAIDAAILNFSTDDIMRFLAGDAPFNMIIRDNGKKARALPMRRGAYEAFSMPIPRQEIFMRRQYRLPFVKRPFATVLTDFGCPFRCSFCIMSTLGYRYRETANVLEELDLIQSLNIRDIFFIDQTFRPRRSDNMELCEAMIARKYGFKWICYSRVDVVDEDILARMKEAGCTTIMFGVESGDPEILERYRKGYTLERIHETFALCKMLGIRTVATFILGLPDDTEESCRKTIELACSLECDYASFNFAVPRGGTKLRTEAIGAGLIDSTVTVMDQSGTFFVMPTHTLSTEQLRRLRRLAVRKYYLRPRYILKRLRALTSPQEFGEMLYAGISLFRNL